MVTMFAIVAVNDSAETVDLPLHVIDIDTAGPVSLLLPINDASGPGS